MSRPTFESLKLRPYVGKETILFKESQDMGAGAPPGGMPPEVGQSPQTGNPDEMQAPESANGFSRAGAEMLANGKYACTWAFNFTPNVDSFRATLVTALAAYSAAPSDATWAEVVKAFVDGWAYEYSVEGN